MAEINNVTTQSVLPIRPDQAAASGGEGAVAEDTSFSQVLGGVEAQTQPTAGQGLKVGKSLQGKPKSGKKLPEAGQTLPGKMALKQAKLQEAKTVEYHPDQWQLANGLMSASAERVTRAPGTVRDANKRRTDPEISVPILPQEVSAIPALTATPTTPVVPVDVLSQPRHASTTVTEAAEAAKTAIQASVSLAADLPPHAMSAFLVGDNSLKEVSNNINTISETLLNSIVSESGVNLSQTVEARRVVDAAHRVADIHFGAMEGAMEEAPRPLAITALPSSPSIMNIGDSVSLAESNQELAEALPSQAPSDLDVGDGVATMPQEQSPKADTEVSSLSPEFESETTAVLGAVVPTVIRENASATREALPQQNSDKITISGASQAMMAPAVSIMPPAAQASREPAQLFLDIPMHQEGWDQELGEHIEWMAQGAHNQAKIHLNPAELGPIAVTLSIKDKDAVIEFAAQHAATREAVESAMPKLREMLADAGIQVQHMSVEADMSRQSSDLADSRRGFQDQADERPTHYRTHDERNTAESENARIVTPLPASWRNGLVDAYV
jgi:flagellar hook-length control protein FliK